MGRGNDPEWLVEQAKDRDADLIVLERTLVENRRPGLKVLLEETVVEGLELLHREESFVVFHVE